MISRRTFLKSSLFFSSTLIPINSSRAAKNAHVVIVGAGWGGLSAAKTLRNLNKSVKITIIEKEKNFKSCPISNWVIGQIKDMKDITFSYDLFIKNNDINFITGSVSNIDTTKQSITLKDTKIKYDKLIVSPGVKLEYEKIIGLTDALDSNSVYTAWKAGEETRLFSNQVKNIEDNNKIIITIPLSPYRCPPGPYERASLIANYIKKNNIRSKVLVLDANQKIVSKGKLFNKAWAELYPDIIEYKIDSKINEINLKEKTIYTEFDEYKFDLANIIPPQRAPDLLKYAGLVEDQKRWASVNSYDFSSKLSNGVYIIGDATDRASVGSVPKSGYIAYSMGKVCGYAVHNALLDKDPPSPSMINTCYSLVSQDEGISVSAVYKHDQNKNKIVTIKDASGVSPERSEIIAYNAWDWARAIWNDMLT